MAAQWGFRLLSHPNGTKPSVDPTDATGAPQLRRLTQTIESRGGCSSVRQSNT
jgi:hypothetical protein